MLECKLSLAMQAIKSFAEFSICLKPLKPGHLNVRSVIE